MKRGGPKVQGDGAEDHAGLAWRVKIEERERERVKEGHEDSPVRRVVEQVQGVHQGVLRRTGKRHKKGTYGSRLGRVYCFQKPRRHKAHI